VARALILTYHAIEDHDSPLCVSPELFRRQLDCIVEAQAQALTVRELAAALRQGTLSGRPVVITFDDAFQSAARIAAPLLDERGLRATFFCVADYVGRTNDWPTQPADAVRLPLATQAEVRQLAAAGFEIGAHGLSHRPLASASAAELQQELVEARRKLVEIAGTEVDSVAYPYGVGPHAAGRRLVETTYSAACVGGSAEVTASTDVYALPRVDVHYVRHEPLLRRALSGSLGPYLGARRLAARARRVVSKDYADL
jgi:peptidoglycan/xylan/chitin deacetylase (PgdA/CDA1 family)